MLSSKVRILPKSQKKIKKNLGVTKIILIFVKQNTIGGLDAPRTSARLVGVVPLRKEYDITRVVWNKNNTEYLSSSTVRWRNGRR